MKLRSILEKPKLDPPLKKAAAGKVSEISRSAKLPGGFAPAPASEEMISNVAALLSRLKIAKPDQKDGLVEQLARLSNGGAYLASLLPTVEEEPAYMIRSALMRSKDAEAFPYLVRALESDKLYVQIDAIVLLGILGNRDAGPSIRAFLQDSPPGVKSTAIAALQELGDASSLEAVSDLLGDPDDMVRVAALSAALELGNQHDRMDIVKDSIRRNLLGSQGRIAKELLGAVGRAQLRDLWPTVNSFLNDADPLLRKTAAVTLGILAVPDCADAVTIRLDQEDDVRTLVELSKTAGALKSTVPIPALIRRLRNPNEDVVKSSAAALTVLTNQQFGTREDKWVEWWERNSQR